jgi:hypothetical protein
MLLLHHLTVQSHVHSRETKTHQIAYTSTSVGYATATTALWMLLLGLLIEMTLTTNTGTNTGLDFVLQTVLLVILLTFSVPLHCLSGYLIGLNTTRRLPFMRIGLEPFLLRSAFVLQM